MVRVYKITALIIVFCVFEYAETHKCPIGWHLGYGKCYYFSRFRTTFWSAMSFCKTVGGKLVEIDSYWEFRVVTNMARNRRFPSFWIGVTDMYSEGVWQKATSLGRQRYFNWKHAEPNSDGGQENCVEVYTHHHMKWNDRRCSSSWSFVCEK